jgi:hypothetical protein
MLRGWWLEFFVNVQKLSQLQNLQRVHGGGPQARCHIIGELVVLLQSGVPELKEIASRCAEAAAQLVASFISEPSPRCCLLAGADEVIELSDDFRSFCFFLVFVFDVYKFETAEDHGASAETLITSAEWPFSNQASAHLNRHRESASPRRALRSRDHGSRLDWRLNNRSCEQSSGPTAGT